MKPKAQLPWTPGIYKSKRTISVEPKAITSLTASKKISSVIELTFTYSEFVPACKKTSLFHLLIFDIQSILDYGDQTGHTHF